MGLTDGPVVRDPRIRIISCSEDYLEFVSAFQLNYLSFLIAILPMR